MKKERDHLIIPDEKIDLNLWIEARKLQNDMLKHVATLDTASILLVVTFLEKLFAQPKEKYLVVASLIAFSASLIGIVYQQLTIVERLKLSVTKGWKEWSKVPHLFQWIMDNLETITIPIVYLGFVLGLMMLVAFAVLNMY